MKVDYNGYIIKPAVYGDESDYAHRIHISKHSGSELFEGFVELNGSSATLEEAEKISMRKAMLYIDSGKLDF